MEFFWQVLELALKQAQLLEFGQMLLDSITKIAPLSPFEVVDRTEESLARFLEETHKKIMAIFRRQMSPSMIDRGKSDEDDDILISPKLGATTNLLVSRAASKRAIV